eukprot:TRINITY_DN12111_c0_g1_i3.p1 TRINITY_DN12111_c0_g1~~TRINITY_DN12111_c0_g1_i3.p1  ORF type:complete len:869 (-),score=183.58 TRINITY_DN12111_c0_g1_i3:177-2783(-)
MASNDPSQSAAAGGPDAGEDSRIRVAVRCRPLSGGERSNMVHDICRVMDHGLVILLDPGAAASNDYLRQDKTKEKRFAFDQAFGPDVNNEQLFEVTTKPLIDCLLQGYNTSVFAYGSTGAGKTFTMIGTSQEPGIMSHTVEALFTGAAGTQGSSLTIHCSFVEVYNENLRDLGSADGKDSILDLREDPVSGISVAGVTEIQTESVQEVMELLQLGNQRRTTEPTAMNVTSSRSHAVLQARVERREAGDPMAGTLVGRLSMIDLAGSERASQTNNSGIRLLEGANINRSLLALGNCINALASGSPFVPFRDSKLTRLLKDSLGGNCRTVMVANVSPSHLSYEDTLNTLKYANRAKNIRVTAKQNLLHPDTQVSQLEQAISDLQSEVALLKGKLMQRTAPNAQVQDSAEADDDVDESELKEASENWKLEVIKNLESRTSVQRSLIEVERALVEWKAQLQQAKEVIVHWSPLSPGSPSRRLSTQPRNLEEWKDHVSQIEEHIRENIETRKSLSERLKQNKMAGKELQAQLPRRVLNEDLRAFLELVQRVQVLEVERLELDHFWQIHRCQLEERDQEIAMLREQLRLRNSHIRVQRELLSTEQQEQLPGRVSLLGSTLADSAPVQQHGPFRIVQAWAPPPSYKEVEGMDSLDSRPLGERPASASASSLVDEAVELEDLPLHGKAFNWRALEVPLASQIKGVAQLQQNGGGILAPKVCRDPPLPQQEIPAPPPLRPPRPQAVVAHHGLAPAPRARIGIAQGNPAGHRSPPPMRRHVSLDHNVHHVAARQQSAAIFRGGPVQMPVKGLLHAHGVAAPAAAREQRQIDKSTGSKTAGTPYRDRRSQVRSSSQVRSRSEHSSRMVRAGRFMASHGR